MITWFDHHHRSGKLAAAAQSFQRSGDETKARKLYAEAAQEAERAMELVSREKQFTLGMVAMSAARLWRRAHRSDDAARVARLVRGAPDVFPITLCPLDNALRASARVKRT